MPSINVDLDFFDHPKVKRLRAMVGPEAEVFIMRLWAYAGKYHAEDGTLKDHGADEIEGLMGWLGAKGVLLQALLKVGFVLHDAKVGYFIKDWIEHEGHLLVYRERAKVANKAKWDKFRLDSASSNASRTPKEVVKDSQCSTVQYSTVQSNKINKCKSASADDNSEKPVNWENCKTDIQRIVAHYVKVTTPSLYAPGGCSHAQATAIFKVQGKAVGPLLAQCGDVQTTLRVIDLAAEYYHSKGLDWSLYAVSKSCPDYLNTIAKERNYGKCEELR